MNWCWVSASCTYKESISLICFQFLALEGIGCGLSLYPQTQEMEPRWEIEDQPSPHSPVPVPQLSPMAVLPLRPTPSQVLSQPDMAVYTAAASTPFKEISGLETPRQGELQVAGLVNTSFSVNNRSCYTLYG